MKVFDKCIVWLLVATVIGFILPQQSFCDNTAKKTITRHAPIMMSTPEQEITSDMAGGKGKKSKWLWIGLGVAVVGGLLAASGGSGGSSPGNNNGSLTVGW